MFHLISEKVFFQLSEKLCIFWYTSTLSQRHWSKWSWIGIDIVVNSFWRQSGNFNIEWNGWNTQTHNLLGYFVPSRLLLICPVLLTNCGVCLPHVIRMVHKTFWLSFIITQICILPLEQTTKPLQICENVLYLFFLSISSPLEYLILVAAQIQAEFNDHPTWNVFLSFRTTNACFHLCQSHQNNLPLTVVCAKTHHNS